MRWSAAEALVDGLPVLDAAPHVFFGEDRDLTLAENLALAHDLAAGRVGGIALGTPRRSVAVHEPLTPLPRGGGGSCCRASARRTVRHPR